jgi:hypothetical protein
VYRLGHNCVIANPFIHHATIRRYTVLILTAARSNSLEAGEGIAGLTGARTGAGMLQKQTQRIYSHSAFYEHSRITKFRSDEHL